MTSSLAETVTEYPYPGLRPFEPDEADIFFGRKQQVTDLLKRLKSQRLLAVVGPSGCGKSSLIRAGMIPALQAGFMARDQYQWNFAILRPGNQPLLMLSEALLRSGIFGDFEEPLDAAAVECLREDLEAGSRSLADRLILNERAPESNLLILVDQFEELFRFEREGGGDESRAFVNLLLETVRDPDLKAYVVITMRTDFLGQCPVFRGLPEALNDSQYLTPRLTREEIELAIVGPARMFGGDVQDEVVARILNEMGTDPDQLPLMQHLLMRMWRQGMQRSVVKDANGKQRLSGYAPENMHLTMADYDQAGGLLQALGNHAEGVFKSRLDSDPERTLAEQLFRRLTGVAPNGQLIRQSPAPEFGALCRELSVTDPKQLLAVIDKFRRSGRSFLMPPEREAITPASPIDISHESLIRKWSRLQEWTRDQARYTEVKVDIGRDAKAWHEGGRKPAEAEIRESRLVAALAWRELHPTEVPTLVNEFLDACVRRRDQARRAQREKVTAAIVAMVFIGLSVVAGILWQQSRRQAEKLAVQKTELESFAKKLEKSNDDLGKEKIKAASTLAQGHWREAVQRQLGTAVRGDDLQASLLWLAEAYRQEPMLDSKRDLYDVRFSSLLAQHPKLRQLWYQPGLRAAAMTRDGEFVVTATSQGNVNELMVRGLNEPERMQQLNTVHEINTVEFSSNSQYLLAATGRKGDLQGELIVWRRTNPGDKWVQLKPLLHSSPVLAAAFVAQGEDKAAAEPMLVAIVQQPADEAGSGSSQVKWWRSLKDLPVEFVAAAMATTGENAPQAKSNQGDEAILDDKICIGLQNDGHARVATWGDKRGNVRIWNLNEQSAALPPLSLEHRTGAIQAAFSNDGKLLATVDGQGFAWVWEITGEPALLWSSQAHAEAATYVAFSPNDSHLVTAGDDAARLWSINRKKTPNGAINIGLASLGTIHEGGAIVCAKFSPDGRWVATSGRDRTIRVWDVTTRRQVGPPLRHALSAISLDFSSDGFGLLTQLRGHAAQFWEFAAENPSPQRLRGGNSPAGSVAYSENGKHVAVSGRTDDGFEVRIWSLGDGQSVRLNWPWMVSGAYLSKSGEQFMAVGYDGPADSQQQVMCLWAASRNKSIPVPISDLGAIRRAAFSADGQYLLTASEPPPDPSGATGDLTRDATSVAASKPHLWQLLAWKVATGERLSQSREQPGPVNHIVWNEKSDLVIVSSGNAKDPTELQGLARLWRWSENELTTVSELKHAPPTEGRTSNAVLFSAFSPVDDHSLATGGADDSAYLWSLRDGKHPSRSPAIKHASDIVHVAFSEDGKQLVTSSIGDKRSNVWEVAKLQVSNSIVEPTFTVEHNGRVNRAVFASDGKWMAITSNDGTARVWNLPTGELAAVLRHDGNVEAAFFTEDLRHLITVSSNRNDVFYRRDWPQRCQWRLRSDATSAITSDDREKRRSWARLLAASDLDPERAIMPTLSPSGHSLSAVTATPGESAKEFSQLWNSNHVEAFGSRSSPMTHLEAADASEASRQWYATAWHLTAVLRGSAPSADVPAGQNSDRAELHARLGRAILNLDPSNSPDQLTKATEQFLLARDCEPERWQRWDELASVRRRSSDRNEWRLALDDYGMAIDLAKEGRWWLYSARAKLYGELEQPKSAVADWTKAIEFAPADYKLELSGQRGEEQAKLKNWKEAADDLLECFKSKDSGRTLDWAHRLALVQLKAATEVNAYRAICEEVAQKYALSRYTPHANSAVWICVLAPQGRDQYDDLVQAAERVVAQSASSGTSSPFEYLNTLGAVHYRAGNFMRAKETLNESRRANEESRRSKKSVADNSDFDPQQSNSSFGEQNGKMFELKDEHGSISDWLFLAMTCHKLGEVPQAKKWLKQARDGISIESTTDWINQCEHDLLLAEATQMINSSVVTTPGK